jgi:hypothetical protein
MVVPIYCIIYKDYKKFDVGYCCDLFIIKSNFNMSFGLISCSKLNVVSFIKIYGKEISVLPFVYNNESGSYFNLTIKAPENTDFLEFCYQEITIQLKNLTTILPTQSVRT